MKRFIPNTITSLNLFSGCIGVVLAYQGNYQAAFYCLLAGGLFDFLDGTAARLLNVKSVIGKELDSLADVISFGFLPGTIVYMLFKESTSSEYLPYFGYLITIFSAIRLAKFNVDERQTTDFIGINTPMNSFLVISLPFIALDYPQWVLHPAFLVVFTLISSFLLVSELKVFSMKLSDLSWQANKFKYSFLLLAIVLIILLKYTALPFIFIAYIFFSVLHFNSEKNYTKDE